MYICVRNKQLVTNKRIDPNFSHCCYNCETCSAPPIRLNCVIQIKSVQLHFVLYFFEENNFVLLTNFMFFLLKWSNNQIIEF